MSRKPCRFFSKAGGCRKNDCPFAHIGPPGVQSGSAPQQRDQHISSLSSAASPSSANEVPRGVCRTYWTSGACNKGFDCRYRHEQDPAKAMVESTTGRSTSGVTIPEMLVPLLHPSALARLSEPGTDALFIPNTKARTPTEVHNGLKRFFYNNYQFRHAFDIYAFLGLLADATSHNSSWTTEEGQLLLSTIAKGTGLLRINDILVWESVSVRAGNNKMTLSFQRGYVPLLQYLSSDFVVKSIMSHLINALYMLLMEHFETFVQKVQSCMNEAVTARKTFNEAGTPAARAIGGSQIFGCLATVLLQCLTRVKNATAKYPQLRILAHDVKQWLDSWIAGISASPPVFTDPLTSSPSQVREQICKHLSDKADQLVTIVDREYSKSQRPKKQVQVRADSSEEGVLAALHNAYVGPGDSRPEGPRHDNDHVDITEIRIPPTHEELICRVLPFLPANLFGAPHPLPSESPERLLDIQFRLLREELTASLRTSVQQILDDLQSSRPRTQLAELMKRGGGKYRGHSDSQDSVLFNLYTNAEFLQISPDRKGISVGLSIDTPPGRARAPEASRRAAFWESMSGKRLMSGGLVALIWKTGFDISVHLGLISSSLRDHASSARQNETKISVRVAFFDPQVELRILHQLRRPMDEREGVKLLIEATVMYASVRPFLEALRVEPTSVPFTKYLVHRPPGFFDATSVDPPAYARLPGFEFQLSSLFAASAGVEDLKLSVSDPESVQAARELLRTESRLDPSQADAITDALTREVALIQGPPGTGKSYTGVELLRVLIENKAGPILMIAFTNHALDHMLCSVLDASITQRIVRLGSRSSDERIARFSIETMEEVAGRSRLDRAFASNHRELKQVEEEVKTLMKDCLQTTVDTADILNHLEVENPMQFYDFHNVPEWISILYKIWKTNSDGGGEWTRVGRGGRSEEIDDSTYAYWLTGSDLEFLQRAHSQPIREPPAPHSDNATLNPSQPSAVSANQFEALTVEAGEGDDSSDSLSVDGSHDLELNEEILPEEAWMLVDEESEPRPAEHAVADAQAGPSDPHIRREFTASSQPSELQGSASVSDSALPLGAASTLVIQPSDFYDVRDFFHYAGCDQLPPVPSLDRRIEVLTDVDEVWDMSLLERKRIHAFWADEVRRIAQETRIQEFERLRQKHTEALEKYNEGKSASRCQMLKNVDIIGCTTTGAANLTALLKAIGPKIMLVEEAGQVLEAHVLGSLVPSVQHLILIGDPLQLRPTLNNYALSMDHRHGSLIYKFDMSLMERLSSSGFPMSQINVQRRMRPSISDLVRTTLYPQLEDHELVKNYVHVQGMAKNVFFLSHNHKENGGEDDAVSKFNSYEVSMIVDLVMYLLRQGPYGGEGDIVVLCAYLGQLARVRDALADKVAVVIDERDQRELEDREAENDTIVGSTSTIEHVKVSKRVRLRTIDNYQGEEAKIVILSLVRNSGGSEEDENVHGHSSVGRVNVGFLKSENRTNVALSRAREGLFILGNGKDLASRSKMWRTVISLLEKDDSVGDGFPITCHRHQDDVQYISRPGELPRIAPDGGCLRQCDARLGCGHLCPFKCHSDDPNHIAVTCTQRCTRLCPRGHPCSKSCADDCGKCQTLVSNVELPCGHTKSHVHCAALDDLSEVICDAVLRKKLPNCEHEADMKCSDNPAQYLCRELCGGIMICCGRDCKSQCHQCQMLNTDAAREAHSSHPCQKRLYCEHLCNKPCAADHQCATQCQAACRQVCVHAQCRLKCSTPCAPCQEPCTWQCPHHTCPVPCGSICARLPCDIRCENLLSCGHRCPSVCGEDCSIQKCPLCAPQDQEAIVDLILQRSMADVDPDMETVDEMLITIPSCGHTFTVETLDGHLQMTEYYEQDTSGRWSGLQAPPVGFLKPPTCPSCRATITCPRYGRIFKRADLDILERNIASHMLQSLASISSRLDSVSKQETKAKLESNASTSNIVKPPAGDKESVTKRRRQQQAILCETREVPAAVTALDPAAELHGIPIPEAKMWRTNVRDLLIAYRDVCSVAATRSSHRHAWEASFTYLYQQEMEAAVRDPAHAPRNPHEHAMRITRLRIGQPQPRADMRFLVEAFWISVNIRLTLVELAKTWVSALTSRPDYPAETKHMWELYVFFILKSCIHDAKIALSITQASESHRQAIKTTLLLMRVDLEQFNFNVELLRTSDKFTQECRQTVADRAMVKHAAAQEQASNAIKKHREIASRGVGRAHESKWLAENFSAPSQTIIEEYQNIAHSLRADVFYEPVSMEEMEKIVRGLVSGDRTMSHTGHFYKCPNGHTYIITECGGASQQASCPECGAAIGGQGHQLLSSNSRATEFEEIARAQGAQRSPWAWGV